MRYANMFTEISGATSIQQLATDFRTALDDPKIDSIVLEIDSPGGEVSGVSEFAEQVRLGAQGKRVVAYVSNMGASAAYWIASAASEVVVRDTAQVGSIGVVARLRRDAEAGTVKVISRQSPLKHASPSTESGLALYQAEVDALAEVFVDAVAAYRGVSADTVLSDFGRGGVLFGKAAVAAGMADRVGSLRDVLDSLGPKRASSARGTHMAKENEPAVTRERLAAEQPQLVEALREEGRQAALTEQPALLEQARREGAAAERERIKAVEAQTMPGHEALIAALMFDGVTTGPEAAVQVLQAERQARKTHADRLHQDAPAPLPAAAHDGTLPNHPATTAPTAEALAQRARELVSAASQRGETLSLAAAVALAQKEATPHG
jgi:ClpP class serine protease